MHLPGSSILIRSILPSDSKMNVSVSFNAIFISSSEAVLWRFLFPCFAVIWLLHHISSLYSPDKPINGLHIPVHLLFFCLFVVAYFSFNYAPEAFFVRPRKRAWPQVPMEIFNTVCHFLFIFRQSHFFVNKAVFQNALHRSDQSLSMNKPFFFF